jgi:hypothetical protein
MEEKDSAAFRLVTKKSEVNKESVLRYILVSSTDG